MSYDLAIWKRSATTKTAMLEQVYSAICEGDMHPAMAPFDLASLEEAIRREFGDVNRDPDGPFLYSFGEDSVGAWLIVNCNYSTIADVLPRIVALAIPLGLLVYNPQERSVWGNRRPPRPPAPTSGKRTLAKPGRRSSR